jgi:hypothetical protein
MELFYFTLFSRKQLQAAPEADGGAIPNGIIMVALKHCIVHNGL